MKAGQDTPRFLRAIGLLFAGRQKEPSDLELEAYWETLEEFDIALVERVMYQARKKPGGFAASDGDLWQACFAAKPDPNAPRALPEMPAKPLTPEQESDVREMIASIKSSLWRQLATAKSGLPEAERAEATIAKHEERRR